MSDRILKALMHLFALIASPGKSDKAREIVVYNFLKEKLNTELVEHYINIFKHYYKTYQKRQSKTKKNKFIAVSSVKLLTICTLLNKELSIKERYIVLIRLVEFIKSQENTTSHVYDFLKVVAETFLIPYEDFHAIKKFVFNEKDFFKKYQDNILVIAEKPLEYQNIKFILAEGLEGQIIVYYLSKIKLHIFKFYKEKELFLNQHLLKPDIIYTFSYGSSLRTSKIRPIYYSEIVSAYTLDKFSTYVTLEADRISYHFPNGKIGIHEMSFVEKSGKLVGILGSSGSGKTTLLKILNGNYKPHTGKVLINGIDIHKNKELIKAVIGYVPQEDFLIEELTVFENLYFSAKLSFGNYSDFQIRKSVIKLLKELGLYEIKDHIVGSPLNRRISGGQRKRLNIALELIRQPPILFLDEPTSGLSSSDSENIMDLLKELTFKGKLVFVVIHQPSSDIYKMFDRIFLLDQGGYLIYNGPPIEAISYFRNSVDQANWTDSECPVCGTVKSEQIFKIVEAKVLDEHGRPTNIRKISPREWYLLFKKYEAKKTRRSKVFLVRDLLHTNFNIPKRIKQLRIFLARDALAKLSNIQYVLLNLLETPILAFILSSIIKYWNIVEQKKYLLYYNDNLPVYLFMSVIIAVFIGISVSAQEIIKDREIRERESFLNLSRGSYLLSKVFILLVISAYQSFAYVIIANKIMSINEMLWKYWLILFSVWFTGNLIGLNISDTFKSTVTIYILIPFLIIPQILLSGVLVPFDKLNPHISSPVKIPWYGEIMSARWGYEALAVIQFRDNSYEKLFYSFEKTMSQASYVKDYWIPTLLNKINFLRNSTKSNEDYKNAIKLLYNELKANHEWNNKIEKPFNINHLNAKYVSSKLLNQIEIYLKKLKSYYIIVYNKTSDKKNSYIISIQQDKGSDYLINLKLNYHNDKLEEFVKNFGRTRILEYKHKLYRKITPIFYDGEYNFLKSHFYAPYKKIFKYKIDTFWANIIVLWFFSAVLFIMLYYRTIYYFLNYIEIIYQKLPLSLSSNIKKRTRSKFIRSFIKFLVK